MAISPYIAKKIIQMHNNGCSMREIARKTGISRPTICKYIQKYEWKQEIESNEEKHSITEHENMHVISEDGDFSDLLELQKQMLECQIMMRMLKGEDDTQIFTPKNNYWQELREFAITLKMIEIMR